jgi:hypothetical protein
MNPLTTWSTRISGTLRDRGGILFAQLPQVIRRNHPIKHIQKLHTLYQRSFPAVRNNGRMMPTLIDVDIIYLVVGEATPYRIYDAVTVSMSFLGRRSSIEALGQTHFPGITYLQSLNTRPVENGWDIRLYMRM